MPENTSLLGGDRHQFLPAATAHQSLPVLPAALSDVALINAETAAAVGGMRPSWWYEEVRAGRAPQPAVRKPRCTRWRLCEVREFWLRFADQQLDAENGLQTITKAVRASAAAKAKRGGVGVEVV